MSDAGIIGAARARNLAAGIGLSRGPSTTVKYWRQSLVWAIGLILAAMLLHLIEKYIAGMKVPHRMFWEPGEVAMRIFGFPHYVIALLFMLSSRRMRITRNWLWFVALFGISIALIVSFDAMGGIENPLMFMIIYYYFLIHDFRDQAHFYLVSEECPKKDRDRTARLLVWLQWMMLPLLFAFLIPTSIEVLRMMGELPSDSAIVARLFPASAPFAVKFGAFFVPVLLVDALIFFVIERRYPGGWSAIWREHRPIMRVFLIYAVLILFSPLLGPGIFVLIVLAHFVAWWRFAERGLRSVPKPNMTRNLWRWMRTTFAGFRTLNVGLTVIFALFMALTIYGFGSESPEAMLLGETSFYYLTILHITLSWVPR